MEFIAIRQRLDIIEKALGLVKAPILVANTPPVPDEPPETEKDEAPLE